jgi:hypothetical protein
MNLSDITEPTEILVSINGATASKRTRNRVKEHGPRFVYVPNKNRADQILLKGVDGKGWNGWLPLWEIKVSRVPLESTPEEMGAIHR